MKARPEAILHLVTEFTDTVLSLDGTDATVFEGILALALASEQSLRVLQAAGKFSDEQIESVKKIVKKFFSGKVSEREQTPLLPDSYGVF